MAGYACGRKVRDSAEGRLERRGRKRARQDDNAEGAEVASLQAPAFIDLGILPPVDAERRILPAVAKRFKRLVDAGRTLSRPEAQVVKARPSRCTRDEEGPYSRAVGSYDRTLAPMLACTPQPP